MSATMNTVASIIYDDYIRPMKITKHSDSTANFTMKCIIVFIAISSIALGSIVEQFPNIVQITMTIISVLNGVVLGVFSLGMLWPWANKYGAGIGILISTACMLWISYRAQTMILQKQLVYKPLPTTTDGCDNNNSTSALISNSTVIADDVIQYSFSIYRISFVWYSLMGSSIVFFIGIIVSWLTGHQEIKNLDPNLLSPVVQFLIPKTKAHSPNHEHIKSQLNL